LTETGARISAVTVGKSSRTEMQSVLKKRKNEAVHSYVKKMYTNQGFRIEGKQITPSLPIYTFTGLSS